mmetsp:Transcript_62717/g.149622  ORF Transcript_62717/g.149622 Transcript_62717/m.149622 type:complete len:420 (-) Transcript_62717:56-1315(-)
MATPDDSTRERVKTLGDEIRNLKAQLKKEGLQASAINKNQAVLDLVAELAELKKGLAEGDSLTDEAFFAQQRQEKEAQDRQRKQQMEEERALLQAAQQTTVVPLVQRKIFHLFRFAGNGPNFHYEPPARLNAEQTGLGPEECPPLYLTEKWDGTTMQATNSAVFRRLDLATKRKGEAQDASQRYTLRLVAWREPSSGRWNGLDHLEADTYVAEALRPYLHHFEAMEPDLCVYFECVHTFIQARYRHLDGLADIRVFDFARCGEDGSWQSGRFLPFDETVALAERHNLPIVGFERHVGASAESLWKELEAAKSKEYKTAKAPLEGYVVREASGAGVAKARVEHLRDAASASSTSGEQGKLAAASSPAASKQKAASTPPPPKAKHMDSLDMVHLQHLGLQLYRGPEACPAQSILRWPARTN